MESPNPTMSDHIPTPRNCELVLIRHAPADTGGRLCGRTDVDAILPGPDVLARIAQAVGAVDHLAVSPARRCRQTAAALFPGLTPCPDPRLWEQDFGAWEGLALASLPDLGPMSPEALVHHCPPRGESFADLCARMSPAFTDLSGGRVAVVAHAGTVRAALALALGGPAAALACEVAPLSHSMVRLFPGGAAVAYVNRVVA